MNKLKNQDKLPSQTIVNPKENVSVVTLRNKKELLQNPCEISCGHNENADLETESTVPKSDNKSTPTPASTELDTWIIKPPFPEKLAKSKKEKEEKEILKRFHKVEINITLLDTIKQVPRCEKFLKELCTKKKKLVDYQKVCMDKNISAVFQIKLPTKCKDQEMGVVIQLADYSIIYPNGVLEDVLVQVDNFIFPADFYVVPMEDNKSSDSFDILLGRPFLSTARTKINVYDGTLTMEFDGKVIKFNIYDNEKYLSNISNVCRIDVGKPLVQQVLKLEYGYELNTKFCENFEESSSMNIKKNFDCLKELVYELKANKPLHHIASIEQSTNIHTKFLPSIVQEIKVEHKLLSGQPPPFINENRTSYSLKLPFQQVFLKPFYKGFKVEPIKEITFNDPIPNI
ncbi:uncharacterized protein LOC110629246 [Manihot esculenta]|uniref:uncharacterized protein LOC110629246 n=1 Tax=Manihot esculenta TaxID=3983 RepID=UPI000B5D0934|nr:uncharacterized protein LOC110629246 [Manihot esculenta]